MALMHKTENSNAALHVYVDQQLKKAKKYI